MPNWRRAHIPGGTFFFTVVTEQRARILTDSVARQLLGNIIRQCVMKWPFTIDAIVLLPDHLHAIWSLPPGDHHYSKRWGWIKKEFTKAWLALGVSFRRTRASTLRRSYERSTTWSLAAEILGAYTGNRKRFRSPFRLCALQSCEARSGEMSARLAMVEFSSLGAQWRLS